MANLNIPFLLLQPSLCSFTPTLSTSKLIPYHKYNFKPPTVSMKHQNVSSSMSKSSPSMHLKQGNNGKYFASNNKDK